MKHARPGDLLSASTSLIRIVPISLVQLVMCTVLTSWSVRADDQPLNRSATAGESVNAAVENFDYSAGLMRNADQGIGWKGEWKLSRSAIPIIADRTATADAVLSSKGTDSHGAEVRGTASRNNPLRRQLNKLLTQPEIFVRFDLFYHADHIEAADVDPEFFVMWLDRLDGGDQATHAANVPNIGLHHADRGPMKGRNVFMVRIGPANTAWSEIEVQPGRDYRVIARLRKPDEAERTDYSRLDLWVNPTDTDLNSPAATVEAEQSIPAVQWLGFATGVKTEPADRIHIDNVLVTASWEAAVIDAVPVAMAQAPAGHNGVVWDQTVRFREDVFPLLQARCFDCHAGAKPESGIRLDVYRELSGYSTGEILAEPGRSHHSRLIEVLTSATAEERMPPEGDPLTDAQIAMLKAWIDQGMKWDEELLPTPRRESDHWAFQTVVRPDVPASSNVDWVRTPVDAFIQRAHQRAGVRHAPEASRLTLVRRLYLDVIGLPPTIEQVDRFVNDPSPTAYEELVEQLLSSPHYGERWGRYWLDLARWAESQGYQHDFVRPFAWRYRDYVIDSFNADKPYDRFLKEQLAGDELQPYSDENLIATGFLGAARISGNEENDAIQRNDVLVDIVNATGSAILGLTLECAQCHNHKFDPISQRDYYQLQAFFVKGQLGNLSLQDKDVPNPTNIASWVPKPAYDFYSKEVNALIKKKLFNVTDKAHTWGYLSAETGDPQIERLPVVNRRPISWQPEALRQSEARMLIRGEVSMPGPVVRSAWPEVLGATPSSLGIRQRSALADWLTSPENPLVARVWVNRIWQYHFGQGIVATPGDFGVEGARPTHPELLDWLAAELMFSGWSTKHIHRQILLSGTFRQQQWYNEANMVTDANNKLLWRWPRRRLEAEAIRDSVLVASGTLDRTIGGVSIPPEREAENPRRTIYLFQQRSSMPEVMEMFDAPAGIASCSRRTVSTVALQPLYLLNSPFMATQAEHLAGRIAESASDVDQQIDFAFRRILSRSPDQRELQLARNILHEAPAEHALMQLCHALLNLNEFLYIP